MDEASKYRIHIKTLEMIITYCVDNLIRYPISAMVLNTTFAKCTMHSL